MKKCEICGAYTAGLGEYSFSYLGETVYLCGHHAQSVMNFIKRFKRARRKNDGKFV